MVLVKKKKVAAPVKKPINKKKKVIVTDLENIHEPFERKLKKLRKLAKDNPNMDPQQQLLLYKALLDSSCSILSTLDTSIHESDSGSRLIYAHNHVTSQIREIMNDMRAVSTNDHQVEKILEMIRSALTSTAQNMVDSLFIFKRLIDEYADAKGKRALQKQLDEIIQSQGKALNETYKLLEAQINDFYAVKS